MYGSKSKWASITIWAGILGSVGSIATGVSEFLANGDFSTQAFIGLGLSLVAIWGRLRASTTLE